MDVHPRTEGQSGPGRSAGQLKFLLDLAEQPTDTWRGFDRPRSEQYSDSATKFQVAYTIYALAGFLLLEPDRGPRIGAAMGMLVDRLLQPRCWDYWLACSETPDPVAAGNAMYAGHLLLAMGVVEARAGATRWDHAFELRGGGHSFRHDHHTLAAAIERQMRDGALHGVPCQRGLLFVQCSNFEALGLRLHGLLTFHGLDAAGLVGLTVLDRELAAPLYRRFRAGAIRRSSAGARPGGEPLARLLTLLFPGILERSMTAAFSYLLARSMGDTELADALLEHIDATYGPTWQGDRFVYAGATSPAAFGSIVALADCLGRGAALQDLFGPGR